MKKLYRNNNWIKQYAIVLFIILFVYLIVNVIGDSRNNDFERAVKFTLKWEGGYVNDPRDPGGETKYGISKRSYPTLDIKSLTLNDAKYIFYQNYWLKAGCDQLFYPMNIIVFDTAVNCGTIRAKEFLEESIDWRDYLLRRIAFYSKLKTARYFLRGWTNRVVDLYYLIGRDGEVICQE